MANMTYAKTVTKSIKPTVVELGFSIVSTGKEPGETITKLNEMIKFCRDFVTAKKSYRPDSYKQKNIDFKKITRTETFYRHKQNPSKTIPAELIDKLSAKDIANYEKASKKVFDKYETSVCITATLDNSETVVDDFTDIVNMCVDKDIYCAYNHNITDEERQRYALQMYSECVNAAIEDVREIITNIATPFNNFSIKEIRNTINDRVAKSMCMLDESSNYAPEQYFIPELIKELFNNNIELKKSLELLIEF